MMRCDLKTRRLAIGITAAALTATAVGIRAAGTGHSFTSLSSGYQQELYATTQLAPTDDPSGPNILGGVAFAPNGDPWVAECAFSNTVLHRFAANELLPQVHATTSRHRES